MAYQGTVNGRMSRHGNYLGSPSRPVGCPLCGGSHNLSKCPRWIIPKEKHVT